MLKKINEAVLYLKEQFREIPAYGIILGSGLGNFVHEIDVLKSIPYENIPHFPKSTVLGHKGNLILGRSGNTLVLAMQGRPHFYEGFTMHEVIFPVRVMHFLGIRNLFISNACGGLNPSFEIGDLMIITDHINLMPNPLIGSHYPEFGERFPDMSEAYDQRFINEAFQISERHSFNIKKGVYIGLTGPTLETPAEYKYLRIIGGDAVGMSTVPEVIAANQMDMRCFGISVITDLGVPGKIEKITHQDVLKAATKAEPQLGAIIKGLIALEQ